jgi:UDP-N-acetylglucosamine:LPS N-acetylglucosamine transferase
LVLIAFGGISGESLLPDLPRQPDITWLVDGLTEPGRPDTVSIDTLTWSFPDLLRSVDVIVSKIGYGTVTEATCNGARVLYLRRGNWVEEPYLVDWLQRHAVCCEIQTTELAESRFVPTLHTLLAQSAKPGPPATGGLEAADALATFLG